MPIKYAVTNRKELPKSLLQFEIEIPAEEIAPLVRRVLERLAGEAEMPGFRKGNVPEKMLRERVGELALWEKAAGEALTFALPEAFKTETIDAIGHPSVAVTMLAPGNPLRAQITVARLPRFAPPDYKGIAARANARPGETQTVEEKEVDAVIAEIKKIRAGEKTNNAPLTDETVKQFGNFNSVAELRAAVAENLKRQKEERERGKRRAALLHALVSEMKTELPDILIGSELARMEAELEGELKRFGGTMEKYLTETKKTREELRKEMEPDAMERARLHMLLQKIAEAEKIIAPVEQVETEVKRILAEHKDANPEAVRIFVETLLTNEKVIAFLEDQK